jgi:hypothetical protein
MNFIECAPSSNDLIVEEVSRYLNYSHFIEITCAVGLLKGALSLTDFEQSGDRGKRERWDHHHEAKTAFVREFADR